MDGNRRYHIYEMRSLDCQFYAMLAPGGYIGSERRQQQRSIVTIGSMVIRLSD
jgi:hypothetical protein